MLYDKHFMFLGLVDSILFVGRAGELKVVSSSYVLLVALFKWRVTCKVQGSRIYRITSNGKPISSQGQRSI